MSLQVSIPLIVLLLTIGVGLFRIGQLIEKKQDKARCDVVREHCHIGNGKIFDLLFEEIKKVFEQLEYVKISIGKLEERTK